MKNEQLQRPEKVVRGQYFKPKAQDNPFSGFRERLLQAIVQLYPEVLEALRQEVLEPYRRLGPHVAFHYAKSLPRRKIESVEAFRDSIPKFVFSMALGYAPQGESVSFRFRAITEFLATYPNPDELNEFWQFAYEEMHAMETQLSGLSGTARLQLYEWFEAQWDARVPDETVAVFAGTRRIPGSRRCGMHSTSGHSDSTSPRNGC